MELANALRIKLVHLLGFIQGKILIFLWPIATQEMFFIFICGHIYLVFKNIKLSFFIQACKRSIMAIYSQVPYKYWLTKFA